MGLEALTDVEAAIQDGIPADPAVAEPFSPELVEKVASVVVVYRDITPLDVLYALKLWQNRPDKVSSLMVDGSDHLQEIVLEIAHLPLTWLQARMRKSEAEFGEHGIKSSAGTIDHVRVDCGKREVLPNRSM